eukprot:m.251851 g.251851  ORF g.251851 m.251851 type:complete len:133 (-) comp19547_c0_seq2:487-885(-)
MPEWQTILSQQDGHPIELQWTSTDTGLLIEQESIEAFPFGNDGQEMRTYSQMIRQIEIRHGTLASLSAFSAAMIALRSFFHSLNSSSCICAAILASKMRSASAALRSSAASAPSPIVAEASCDVGCVRVLAS